MGLPGQGLGTPHGHRPAAEFRLCDSQEQAPLLPSGTSHNRRCQVLRAKEQSVLTPLQRARELCISHSAVQGVQVNPSSVLGQWPAIS